ncbi:MAG: TRAP transporter permease, partial [Deltaproteobacteria bacterium]
MLEKLRIKEGLKTAEELLKEETGDVRTLRPLENILVSIIAIAWALYQLALPSVLVIDSTEERAIHLAFAISLLFLLMPALKKRRKYLGYLSV